MQRLLALLIALSALAACRPEYRFAPQPVALTRSQDTVYLDTVFATVGSSTRSVRLVNPSAYDVNLSRVHLGRGAESPFRFNANGQAGPDLQDVVIPAGDSIWIFVETTAPRGDGEMLWEDSLLVEQGSYRQNIHLVALAWDAHFHYPNRVLTIDQPEPFADLLIPYVVLGAQEVWSDDKPHVVYGYAVVDSGATLTIAAGARVHFHHGSGLWVASGGTLRIDPANAGSFEDPVVLEGDRLEPFYRHIAGQWGGLLGGIFIQRGARAEIQNAWIRNGSLGIRCDSVADGEPHNLIVRRSRITDFSRAAVYSGFGRVRLENSVVSNSGLYNVYVLGGRLEVDHCTLANAFPGARSTPSLGLFNRYDDGTGNYRYRSLLQADVRNSVVDGSQESEVGFGYGPQAAFNYRFEGSLIKLNRFPSPALYDVTDPQRFGGCVFNAPALFESSGTYDYRLKLGSAALGIGWPGATSQVPADALGNARPQPADAGALETW
ncbi:MAG: hypothetical protein RL104_201 [Bacteroidota bacterium]|jgi:hypothetical protein